jgi:hypothetical protein
MKIDLVELIPHKVPISFWTTHNQRVIFKRLSGRVKVKSIGSNQIEIEVIPKSKTRLAKKTLCFKTVRYISANLNLGLFMALWFGEGSHLGKGNNNYWGMQHTNIKLARLFIRLLKDIFKCPDEYINVVGFSKDWNKKALAKYLGAKRTYVTRKTKNEREHWKNRIFIRLRNVGFYLIVVSLEQHFKRLIPDFEYATNQ